MNELKSCPFCGTNDWLYHIVDENTITSPIEDDLRARIAELEAFIKRLIEAGNELEAGFDEYWEELSTREVDNWRRLVKDWKERE